MHTISYVLFHENIIRSAISIVLETSFLFFPRASWDLTIERSVSKEITVIIRLKGARKGRNYYTGQFRYFYKASNKAEVIGKFETEREQGAR